MNPDDINGRLGDTGSTTWTLVDSEGNVVLFRSHDDLHYVTVVNAGGGVESYNRDLARLKWDEYMKKGYRIQNKCKVPAMSKFHDAKRAYESYERKYKDSKQKDMIKAFRNYALEA